jgi:hypothetical protein
VAAYGGKTKAKRKGNGARIHSSLLAMHLSRGVYSVWRRAGGILRLSRLTPGGAAGIVVGVFRRGWRLDR